MTGDVAVCPDCESADVTYFGENVHPYYCWDCGIRFCHPDYQPEEEVPD